MPLDGQGQCLRSSWHHVAVSVGAVVDLFDHNHGSGLHADSAGSRGTSRPIEHGHRTRKRFVPCRHRRRRQNGSVLPVPARIGEGPSVPEIAGNLVCRKYFDLDPNKCCPSCRRLASRVLRLQWRWSGRLLPRRDRRQAEVLDWKLERNLDSDRCGVLDHACQRRRGQGGGCLGRCQRRRQGRLLWCPPLRTSLSVGNWRAVGEFLPPQRLHE